AAVWVMSMGLLARGENERLERLLAQLELSGLEAAELSGLFGSIFPAVRMLLATVEGRPVAPEIRLVLAHHDDPVARIARAADAIARNRRDEALALAAPSERSLGDAALLGLRAGIQASALLEAGRSGEAIDLMADTLERRRD